MQPTPNGRLHIGHGAGPYLRADVVARALRRAGHDVAVITGSDAYENWVLADGLVSGRTPQETCAHFHAGIKTDLDNLGVELDAWIDPLAEQDAAAYTALHEHLLEQLRAAGRAELQTERIPLSPNGRPVVGTWIGGRCPSCGAPCGGNTCTACSDHFQPEDVLDPHDRLTGEPITWVRRSSWFTTAPPGGPDILAELRARGAPPDLLAPAARYIARGSRIRLSQPGQWGIASPLAPADSVLSNTYYAYALYCALLHAQLDPPRQQPPPSVTDAGMPSAPPSHLPDGPWASSAVPAHAAVPGPSSLERDSGVTVVGLFGTDNSIAGLVAPHVLAAATGTFKPFDHVVVNHMLHFEGAKCSTSKRHGLWITPLVEGAGISSDELRYALAHLPLDQQVTDVSRDQIAAHVNRLRRWHVTHLVPATRIAAGTPADGILTALNLALDRQHQHLVPPQVDLPAAIDELDAWLFSGLFRPSRAARPDDRARRRREAGAWLHGVALLAAPFLPSLSHRLDQLLGSSSELDVAGPDLARIASTPVQPLDHAHIATLTPSGLLTPQQLASHVGTHDDTGGKDSLDMKRDHPKAPDPPGTGGDQTPSDSRPARGQGSQ